MAVKVKLDKDTILEFLESQKDTLFLAVLALLLVYGGWALYQKSSLSVGDIIDEAIKNPDRPGGKESTVKVFAPEEVINSLLAKRSHAMYDVAKNPFGSPQEQLRLRDEVQKAYNRAVELFNAGEFETAIQQFEQVISLDVTETRISYPIMPNEYIRRARREFLKGNFASMLTSAENDLKEGDRFLSQNQLQQAEQVYSRANKTLSDAIAADTDGSAIGKENLDKITKMQQGVFQKWQTIQSSMLRGEMQKATAQAQQYMGQQDLLALLKAMIQLQNVQEQITLVDPNFTLIKQEERQTLINLTTQIQERLKTGYAELVTQAEAQFQLALTAKDLVKTKEALAVMRLSTTISSNPQDNKSIQQKIAALMVQRTQLVIEQATQFVAQQKDLLGKQQYDQFDADGKIKFLDELVALRTLGGSAISAEQKNQITNLENSLKTDIRKPPLLTEDYDITSISKSATGNTWTIVLKDKKSRTGSRTSNLRINPGERDNATKISLTQVDTAGGFVILSKPGYLPTKIEITQNK